MTLLRRVIWMVVSLSVVARSSIFADDRGPVINIDAFLEKIEKAGKELIASGAGKGNAKLDEGLKRESFELAVPAPRTESLSDKELYHQACESLFVVCGLYKLPPEDQPDASARDGSKGQDKPKGKALPKEQDADEQWEVAFATAFPVTADGILTTSRHFFADPQPCDVFLVADARGNTYPIEEILAASEKLDTCLFRIKAQGLRPLPLGRPAAPTDKVRVVSHPGYFFYYFSAGQVGNYFEENEATWMNISADFGQGSSGAPVFDDYGNVVGQVSSTLTLYATGPMEEEPAIARRRIRTQRKPAEPLADSKGEKSPEKKREKEKKKTEEPPLTELLEEFSDPQMVFKTCAPVDALRSLIKSK